MSPTVTNRAAKAVQSEKTALVVDHVDEMLDLLEIALKCAGFSVIRASSAADAAGLFDQNAVSVDLLLTEVRLGSESGVDLARRLLEAKPSLQVLAISDFARDRKLVNAHRGIAFLPKPFSASELRKTLSSLFPVEQASR